MSEVCQNCECCYDTVFRVPDDVWERLTGHIDDRGLLCPACCDLLARRAGLELYWEATVGEYPVAAEREACAEFAQDWLQQKMFYNTRPAKSPELLAAAIRAGTEEKEK